MKMTKIGTVKHYLVRTRSRSVGTTVCPRRRYHVPVIRATSILAMFNLLLGIPLAHAESAGTEVAAAVDTYLERLVPFGFSGAVLIARGGNVILNEGYGWADVNERIPNSAQTVFAIGSVSKQFTAAAILTLEMQGKLRTSDAISRYFNDVPEEKAGITLHHLLTHTSGIITGTEEYFDENSREQIIARALESPLLFAPGERDAYSNIGYALLASVVEDVSGMAFEDYLITTLFEPAGMEWTGFRRPNWRKNNLARRYNDGVDNGTLLDEPHPDWNFMGAGGVSSTIADLYRWHKALRGTRILSEDAKQKMYTPVANDYGYGWFVLDTKYGRLIQHDGGSSKGTAADFRRYVEEDVVIIILSNIDGEYMLFSARLRDNVRDLAFGRSPPMVPVVSATARLSTDEFVGSYRFDDGAMVEFSAAGNMLDVSGTGQSAVASLLSLSPQEADRYSAVSARAAELLDAVRQRRYDRIEDVASGRVLEFLPGIFKDLAIEFGGMTSFTVLGTVQPTGFDAADAMTVFRIDYGDVSRFFRFYWTDGRIAALGGSGLTTAVQFRAARDDTDRFLGYHIPTGSSVDIRFERDDNGQVDCVVFHPEKRRARRQ